MIEPASVLVWIVGGWLAATCIALLFAVALGMAAAKGDRSQEAGLAALRGRLSAVVERLDTLESPTGKRFFAEHGAREDLARELGPLYVDPAWSPGSVEGPPDGEIEISRRFPRERERVSRV